MDGGCAALVSPAAAIVFGIGVLAFVGYEFANSRAELAPDEDQGIIFALIKGPQSATLEYTIQQGERVHRIFSSFPETENDFVVSGNTESASLGLAGMILKAWDERALTAQDLTGPLMGRLFTQVEGARAFAFSPPPLPRSTDGLQPALRLRMAALSRLERGATSQSTDEKVAHHAHLHVALGGVGKERFDGLVCRKA